MSQGQGDDERRDRQELSVEEQLAANDPTVTAVTPENAKAIKEGAKVTRRLVNKVLAAVGVTFLADAISGGRILWGKEAHEPEAHDAEASKESSKELSDKLDAKAKEIAAKVEAESHGLSDREKALKVVDYVGCALFAWGIKDLLPGGHGHIHASHYGALIALSAIKHQFSDEDGKHHLEEETVSNAKAFGIISGTIVAAEGLNMDVEKAYELAMKGKKPEKKDQVALMTMLSSVLSPVTTTVGSASIMRKMSNELCDGDPAMMAVCTSHISNLSGFLLFGDPPFIAICEKYGFEEGVKWQFQSMLPLALYTLASATYKLNLILAKKEGLTGSEAHKKALADTISGIKNNIPVLVKIITKSLGNIAKYFTGADFSKRLPQDPGGIEVRIGEVLTEKLANVAKLPFDPQFDVSSHEEHEGMVHENVEKVEGGNEVMAGLMDELTRGYTAAAAEGIKTHPADRSQKVHALREAIAAKKYETVQTLGGELGLPTIDIFVRTLKDFHDNAEVDESITNGPKAYTLRQKLNPLAIYDRMTSIHRIKEAIGHNLGDVVNVFPFQAGCVPFLTTAFKDAADALGNLGESVKEAVLFFLIMLFSSAADNYVACKIGLELFPNKPHIPLIAAIQGGSLTAIGNMANVAQFSLDKFPLMNSIKQFGLHIDTMTAAFAYSKALDILNGMGIMRPPKAIKGAGSEMAANTAPPSIEQGRKMTRREALAFWHKPPKSDAA